MRTHTRRQRQSQPGVQHLWGFDNGHLASVVPDGKQHHMWEITVLNGNGTRATTETVTREVIGSLTSIDVRRILRQVEARR